MIFNKGYPIKVFAFFGTDILDYPRDFLGSLNDQGYIFLALDSKAIEYSHNGKVSYTIVNDWVTNLELLEIKKIAWECETNWYSRNKSDFVISGVCWPEIDHKAMHWFWLDAILAGKFANIFKNDAIIELLIIKQELEIPVKLELDGSICKEIWMRELKGKIKVLDSKNYIFHPVIVNDPNIYNYYNQFLFSSRTYIEDKILFFIASKEELARSNDLLLDLKNKFANEIVFFPCEKSFLRDEFICRILNLWKIPIIAPVNDTDEISSHYSNIFLNAYKKSIELSKSDIWKSYLSTLFFHFSYYCMVRWPKLICHFSQYSKIFSENRPKLIISSVLEIVEWHLPIIAAQRYKIPTISIPHSVSFNPSKRMLETDIIKRFDYHFYRDNLYKEILIRNCSIPLTKTIQGKNCTDINSYKVNKIKLVFDDNLFKILVLFSPTSSYQYPVTNSRLIFPGKDPKKQIESIIFLNSIISEFSGLISMRYKVHPSYSELELFTNTNEEFFQSILPADSELGPILDQADLVVGVNYYGSALIHAMQKSKPYINYINDEFFYHSFAEESDFFEMFSNNMITIHSEEKFKEMLIKILNQPDILIIKNEERINIQDYYFNNSNFQSVSESIIALFQNVKSNLVKMP